eukprot:49223-Chlamydomonas_euryale.AAC.1
MPRPQPLLQPQPLLAWSIQWAPTPLSLAALGPQTPLLACSTWSTDRLLPAPLPAPLRSSTCGWAAASGWRATPRGSAKTETAHRRPAHTLGGAAAA